MKTKFRPLAALLLAVCTAAADDKIHIQVPALMTGDAAVSRQPLTLTPTAPLPRTYSTNVFSRQPVSRYTDTNGLCTFSNVLWGYYKLTIPGSPTETYNLTVGTNLSGLVNVVVLVTNAATTLPPDPSTNYYTQAQVVALVDSSGVNRVSSNGTVVASSATNLNFAGAGVGGVSNYGGHVTVTINGTTYTNTTDAAGLVSDGGIGTNLAAANLTGTIPDARLSTNTATVFTEPRRLRNWYRAIARSVTTDTGATTNLALLGLGDSWMMSGAFTKTLRLMSNYWGYGGAGYIPAGTNETYAALVPLTQIGNSAGWNHVINEGYADYSPQQTYMESTNSGNWLSVTGICTSLKVFYITGPDCGTFTITTNSGTPLTINGYSATPALAVTNLTGKLAVDTAHRVYITNGNGALRVPGYWMENRSAGYPYVAINNFARGGNQTTNYSQMDSNAFVLAVQEVKPQAVVVNLGINDILNGGPRSAADYKAEMWAICQRIWSAGTNMDILICTQPETYMADGGETNYTNYREAVLQLAQSNRIAVLDIYDTFGPFQEATNRWPWSNEYHAGTAGYDLYTVMLREMLGCPIWRAENINLLGTVRGATVVANGNLVASNGITAGSAPIVAGGGLQATDFTTYGGAGGFTFQAGRRIRFGGTTDANPGLFTNGLGGLVVGGAGGGMTNSLTVGGPLNANYLTVTNGATIQGLATNAANAALGITAAGVLTTNSVPGGGDQTPWTSDIDAAGYSLTGVLTNQMDWLDVYSNATFASATITELNATTLNGNASGLTNFDNGQTVTNWTVRVDYPAARTLVSSTNGNLLLEPEYGLFAFSAQSVTFSGTVTVGTVSNQPAAVAALGISSGGLLTTNNVPGGSGTASYSCVYTSAVDVPTIVADCGDGLTNSFFVFINTNLTLQITNIGWPHKATFTFYNPSTTLWTLTCPSNAAGSILFGSGVTGWMITTNYSYGTVIGQSNNNAHAVGFAPGGAGAQW